MRLTPPDSAFFDAASSPNTPSLEQALVLHTRRGAALSAGPARTSAAPRPVVDSVSIALMIHQTRSWEGASSARAAPAPLPRPLPVRLPPAPRVFAPATARAGSTHCPLTAVLPHLRGPIASAACLRPGKARRHAPIDTPKCVSPCQCPASSGASTPLAPRPPPQLPPTHATCLPPACCPQPWPQVAWPQAQNLPALALGAQAMGRLTGRDLAYNPALRKQAGVCAPYVHHTAAPTTPYPAHSRDSFNCAATNRCPTPGLLCFRAPGDAPPRPLGEP